MRIKDYKQLRQMYVRQMYGRLGEMEKMEKFIRKVARIQLNDIEIATSSYITDPIKSEMRRKLKKMVREAKVLTGRVRKKHTVLEPAGADKTTMDSSP